MTIKTNYTQARANQAKLFERVTAGKPTAVGVASGAIAGAVAITPSCAFLTPVWAIVLGLVTGFVCAWAIDLKFKFGFDDSLDVVGIHLVGGIVGTLFIGIFGTNVGLAFGNGFSQLGSQAVGVLAIGLYSFGAAWLIATVIQKTIGFIRMWRSTSARIGFMPYKRARHACGFLLAANHQSQTRLSKIAERPTCRTCTHE